MVSDTSTLSILKHLPSETSRILKLSRKPTKLEFEEVAKITALGIVLLGVIGYIFILARWAFENLL